MAKSLIILSALFASFVVTFAQLDYQEPPAYETNNYEDEPTPPPFDLPPPEGVHNGRCIRDRVTKCLFQHSNCTSASSLYCPNRICKCADNYLWDEHLKICRREVLLRRRCRYQFDICSAKNAECRGGTCTCKRGYKLGPTRFDCIPKTHEQFHGWQCVDSIQCRGDLICRNSSCQCSAGKKLKGDFECVPKHVYDECTDNMDCWMAANTVCRAGTCRCRSGFVLSQYMTSATDVRPACITSTEMMLTEGQFCRKSQPLASIVPRSDLCQVPLLCTECEPDVSVCLPTS